MTAWSREGRELTAKGWGWGHGFGGDNGAVLCTMIVAVVTQLCVCQDSQNCTWKCVNFSACNLNLKKKTTHNLKTEAMSIFKDIKVYTEENNIFN